MGKSLIIKGADFSENGFKYEEVKTTISDLYNYQGVKITDWAVQMASGSNGVYYYEKEGALLGKGTGLANIASTLLIDVEDYEIANVYNMCEIGPYGIVLGVAIMLFLDSTQKVIGGFSTANIGATNVVSEGVGQVNTLTSFSKNIPVGTKYAVCSFRGTNAATLFTQFKLDLIKYTVS
jgi:hypothetical protein